jgi:serine phosphatase RsbU (regulator of sigma subunit)
MKMILHSAYTPNSFFRTVITAISLLIISKDALHSQTDTVTVQSKIDEARALFSENPKKSLSIAFQANNLANTAGNKRLIAFSLNTIGSAFNYMGNNDSSIYYHQMALPIQESIHDELGMGRSLTNLGIAYTSNGLNDKAIKCFLQAEQKFIKVKFDVGLSKLYNSLGSLFYNINDFTNSISYYKKAILISEKLDDDVLNYSLKINLANVYASINMPREALALYTAGYTIAKADSNYSDLIMACNNICHEYLELGNFPAAKKYCEEALWIIKTHQIEDYLKTTSFSNQADLLARGDRFQEAVVYVDSALKMLQGSPDLNKEIGLKYQLGKMLYKSGNYQRSYEVLIDALNLKDTLYNKNLNEKLSEINTVHEVEKKESQILSLSESQKKQKVINYLLAGVVVVSLAFLVAAVRSYRRKQRDNEIIRQQKNDVSAKNVIIENKQKEIIDSISYAKRLQDAILPSHDYWHEFLKESFIFYRPKDIVAGDFYWMERSGNYLYVAAADSTGHGVPGAMVSVVCSNALNRSLLEFQLKETGAILDKTKELVISTFEKSGSEVKDGMDISLLRIDLNTIGSGTIALQWSGANNPFYYTKQNNIEIIKADKQPIGKSDNNRSFTSHRVNLNKGEMVYLITDGYADQFGGPGGKKFKYKPLQELLLSMKHKAANDQLVQLKAAFDSWKQHHEQIDDVTVIGIKL